MFLVFRMGHSMFSKFYNKILQVIRDRLLKAFKNAKYSYTLMQQEIKKYITKILYYIKFITKCIFVMYVQCIDIDTDI